jgi:hypothetical protein
MFSRRVKLILLFRGYDTLGRCNTSTRTMARDIPAGKEHGSKVRAPFKALAAKKVNIKIKIKMKKRFFCSFFVLHLPVVRKKNHDIKNAQCVELGKNSVLVF